MLRSMSAVDPFDDVWPADKRPPEGDDRPAAYCVRMAGLGYTLQVDPTVATDAIKRRLTPAEFMREHQH
jgi:hypothetical protein